MKMYSSNGVVSIAELSYHKYRKLLDYISIRLWSLYSRFEGEPSYARQINFYSQLLRSNYFLVSNTNVF